jgi:formylglycine-generating enzyme required for sulfatase activity
LKNLFFLKRIKIRRLIANTTYLSEWSGDLSFGQLNANAPVTNISWFAAKEYCECQGKRLATLDEWEYVAMADEKRNLNHLSILINKWY